MKTENLCQIHVHTCNTQMILELHTAAKIHNFTFMGVALHTTPTLYVRGTRKVVYHAFQDAFLRVSCAIKKVH